MERFRDLYAKMASSGGRTSSSKSPSDKPPLDASKLGLKFNYEPKHARPSLNERIDNAIQIYKSDVDQSLDQQQYVITSQSGRQSYVYQNTNDAKSQSQNGMDTTSARETAIIDAKPNLHYDYMSSSKEALSYVNTERYIRTPDQQLSAESIRSQQIINNYNAQAQKLKQPLYGAANLKSQVSDGFAKIKAMVNESTATELSNKQEDVFELREVSFNGLKNSPRQPVQALMPVLINYSTMQKPLNNQHFSSSFSPRLPETDESKNLDDYNHQSRSPQRVYNLDLIDEEKSPIRSMHRSQSSTDSNEKKQFYETSKLKKSKRIVPYRSQTSHNGAARRSSNRSSNSKSISKGSVSRPTTKNSVQSKKTEQGIDRLRSNCEKINQKKSRPETYQRGHSNGSEPSPTKNSSPHQRIRLQDRAGSKALSLSETRSAPTKTPSQERKKSSFEQPRIIPLRNPRAYRDDDNSSHQRSPSDKISIHDQKSEEKAVFNGVNQDSFGFVQSPTQKKSFNDRSFSQQLHSISETAAIGENSEMRSKIKLNHEKMNLQRMLEDMTMSVNTIRSKYTPDEIVDRSRSQSRTRHHQSMQVDRHKQEIGQDSGSESPKRQAYLSCKTPRDIVQNSLSQTYEQPPTEHTFRPNETSGRMTTDSNFVRKYEERSLEAIRQSQMIIDRHKRKSYNESPPKPLNKTPQPTSLTHITEKEMRKVEQDADRLLESRYMEPTDVREVQEIKEEPRSNLNRSNSQGSHSRNYSRDARRIIEDQNRIVELLNMKTTNRNNERPPLSPGRSFQTEPQPLDRQPITERPNTTRALDHQTSYSSINRNLQMLNKTSGQRDVEYFIQEYRRSQKHQQMQSRSRPGSQDTIEDNQQSFKLESLKPVSRQNEIQEKQQSTYREMSNAEPTTSRSTFTPGIETFCRKNRIQAVSEEDLTDIQQKTEQMCRQMTEARDLRIRQTEGNPLIKDLRQQNDFFKLQNAQLQQEIEYYKQYAKEKQGEIFQLSKKNDQLELDLADSSNSQLFTIYKQLKSDYEEIESQHKSKSFSLDQQSLAMNTLLQQYEKLKESQLSLLAMNKQMLVNHQKEVQELQQNLSQAKTELRAKTEKIETYQEVMKSFNGQINEFEEFQQHSQRDMNKLSEQYQLYKELYEKESMQKQLLIQKLQSGKLKMLKNQKPRNESAKKSKKRHEQKNSKKRRASPYSSEKSQDQTISYLSSPLSGKKQRERSSKNSNRKRKQAKQKEQVVSPQSFSPSSDPTFRRHQSPQRDRSQSITPLRNFQKQATENNQRRERSNSNNVSAKRQQKRSRNDIRASVEDLGLKSNFARVKKVQTMQHDSEPLTTQADDDFDANDREYVKIRHFQMLDTLPEESTTMVGQGFKNRPPPRASHSTSHSFRGISQDYPPDREIQMNLVVPHSRIRQMDQDQPEQQHEFNHISLRYHEPANMENADQKTISQNKLRRSNRSHESHSASHIQIERRISNHHSNNNSDCQDKNQLDAASMSSIPKNFQGSDKERTNMFYSEPTFIMGTYNSDQVIDAETFIDGANQKTGQNQQTYFGPKMITNEQSNYRRRSSSMHRQNKDWQSQNMQAAELIKRVNSRSPSNYKKRKEKKVAPMSSKDYYIRLKQMQMRLDRARQEIQDNSMKPRSNSRSSGGTENTRLQGDLSTIQEFGKGRIAANHTCVRTKEKYRLVGTAANKKSLQTSLKFKSQPGAIKRKQSRSLSANASSSNSAIRQAMAGSMKHSIQPTI